MLKRRRYLIRFGEVNGNGRLYRRDSIDESKLSSVYFVTMSPPDKIGMSFLNETVAHCKLGVDDAGVYMNDFKFMRHIHRPGEPLIDNAKAVMRMFKKRMVYPATAGSGVTDESGVVSDFTIHFVFFTSNPSFAPSFSMRFEENKITNTDEQK